MTTKQKREYRMDNLIRAGRYALVRMKGGHRDTQTLSALAKKAQALEQSERIRRITLKGPTT
jgi:hypothetical protein